MIVLTALMLRVIEMSVDGTVYPETGEEMARVDVRDDGVSFVQGICPKLLLISSVN